ncbi:type II secretion system protein J [Gracilimonas sediminicola]|uniref:PulJ/GspJ family protein n=1 Tax=Gracilimonas sediminicola TaxID=2952158 RepID=UPI0038D43A4E
MVRQVVHAEDGYTLVEILLAMAIFSVVMSLVSVTFIFVSGRMVAWNEQISFYNDVQILNNQLYNDVFRADAISYTDSTLLVEFEEKQNKTYSWTDGLLRINKESLFLPQDSVYVNISEMLEEEQNVVRYILFFKRESRSMTDSATIKVRKPVLWERSNTTD